MDVSDEDRADHFPERQSKRSSMIKERSARTMLRASSSRCLAAGRQTSERNLKRELSTRALRKASSSRVLISDKESSSRQSSSSSGMRRHSSSRVLKTERSSRNLKKAASQRKLKSSSDNRTNLSAASYHGAPRTSSKSSSRSRAAPVRHKSSDNMENCERGRRDDLGAATLHGKSSVSRIRSGTRSASSRSSNSKDKSDRRKNMSRAMSRENVKAPEEYGPSAGIAPETMNTSYGSTEGSRRGGRRRPTKPLQEQEPAIVEQDESSSASDDDSFAGEDDVPVTRASVTRKQHSDKGREAPRRDIIALMREKKKVTANDFQDKENRRIMHFLLYQHKLGIDMAEIQATVDHEIATKGMEEAMRRPIPPLFVEPE